MRVNYCENKGDRRYTTREIESVASLAREGVKERAPLFNLSEPEGDGNERAGRKWASRWLVLDIDEGLDAGLLTELCDRLGPFAHFGYFSRSSSPEAIRVKIFVRLNRKWGDDDMKLIGKCRRLSKPLTELLRGISIDPSSFECSRFQFVPRKPSECWGHGGADFDLQVSEMDLRGERAMEAAVSSFGGRSVNVRSVPRPASALQNEKVHAYLTTPFPKIHGNGTSRTLLYSSLCCCIARNDTETLTQVLEKAKRERWNERELNNQVKNARKFIDGGMA